MSPVASVEITTLARAKDRLNAACLTGRVTAGFAVFLAIGDRRLLLLAGILMLLSRAVLSARTHWVVLLNLIVLSSVILAYYWWLSFLANLASQNSSIKIETFSSAACLGMLAALAVMAWFTLRALGATVTYHRFLPQDPAPRTRARRWAWPVFMAKDLRAATYYLLAVVLAAPLVVVMVDVPAALLHIRSSVSSRYLEFTADHPVLWVSWPILVVLLARGARWSSVKAKRLRALNAAEARRLDPRGPVLLLRSFGDDLTPVLQPMHIRPRGTLYPKERTLEEAIEESLNNYGPVIAIGRPGEKLPPAGAAREYVVEANWLARVKELIGESELISVILGRTEGLRLEYEYLKASHYQGRVLVIFPPVPGDEVQQRWRSFCEIQFPDSPALVEEDITDVCVAVLQNSGAATLVRLRGAKDEDAYVLALKYGLRHHPPDREPGSCDHAHPPETDLSELTKQGRLTLLGAGLALVCACLLLSITTDAGLVRRSFLLLSPTEIELPVLWCYGAVSALLLGAHRRLVNLARLFRLRTAAVAFALAWALPAALLALWVRQLPGHDWALGMLLAATGSLSVAMSLWPSMPKAGLSEHDYEISSQRINAALVASGWGVLLFLLTFGTIHGVRTELDQVTNGGSTSSPRHRSFPTGVSITGVSRASLPKPAWDTLFGCSTANLIEAMGWRAFADLSHAEVSLQIQPAPEGKTRRDLSRTKGALLAGRDLRYISGRFAFLAKSVLHSSDLRGAELSHADLRGADLRNADLRGAILSEADLEGANLRNADLREAYLGSANMRRALLEGCRLQRALLPATHLEEATMDGADVQEAYLPGAFLHGARLPGADLRGTHRISKYSLVQGQLDHACGDSRTKLPDGLTLKTCP